MKKYNLTTVERLLFIMPNVLLLICGIWYAYTANGAPLVLYSLVTVLLFWHFRLLGAIIYYAWMCVYLVLFPVYLFKPQHTNADRTACIIVSIVIAILCTAVAIRLQVKHKGNYRIKK